jgi:hypothetical protein
VLATPQWGRRAQNAAYPGQIKRENGRRNAAAVNPTTNPSLFEVPLCVSALHALAKSVSEFQENLFVARIAELRLRPCPDGSFRFENTVFAGA